MFREVGEGEDDFEEFLREGGESGWSLDLMGWWWITMLVLERGRKKKDEEVSVVCGSLCMKQSSRGRRRDGARKEEKEGKEM